MLLELLAQRLASHARRHDSCHVKCALVCRYAWPVFTVSGYFQHLEPSIKVCLMKVSVKMFTVSCSHCFFFFLRAAACFCYTVNSACVFNSTAVCECKSCLMSLLIITNKCTILRLKLHK